jgi:hypothetical protein
MKKISYYTTLALFISAISACSSEESKKTSPIMNSSTEAISDVTPGIAEAEEHSESYTLITDSGIGVTNNQNTEKPENF